MHLNVCACSFTLCVHALADVCVCERTAKCECVFLQCLFALQLLVVGKHVYCHKEKRAGSSSDAYTVSLSTRGQWDGKVRMNYEWKVEDVLAHVFPTGCAPPLICISEALLVVCLYEIYGFLSLPWQTKPSFSIFKVDMNRKLTLFEHVLGRLHTVQLGNKRC